MSTIKTKNIQQTVISGTTQPLKIGGILEDGSDAKISIGSDGTTALKGTAQSLGLVFDYTVSTSSNTIDLTGFTINKGERYKMYVDCATLSDPQHIYMFVNGNYTQSNYWSGSENNATILYSSNTWGVGVSGIIDISINDDNKYIGLSIRGAGSTNYHSATHSAKSTFNANPITSFRFTNYRGYNFPVGTRFQLVRIA